MENVLERWNVPACENALTATAIISLYLAGRREGIFTKRRRLVISPTTLNNLFRDYVRAHLPPGFTVYKTRRRAVYEIMRTDNEPFVRCVREIREMAIAARANMVPLESCNAGNVCLFILDQELLRVHDLVSWDIYDTFMHAVDMTHNSLLVNVLTLFSSVRAAVNPLIGIWAIIELVKTIDDACKFYSRYWRLQSLYNTLTNQSLAEETEEEVSQTDSALTPYERAIRALQAAAERARLMEGR